MRFTTFHTLNEILSYPAVRDWFRYLFLNDQLELFSEEMRNLPLRFAAFRGTTPWGSNLLGLCDQIVDTANLVLEMEEGKRRCLALTDWTDWRPCEDNNPAFLITTDVTTAAPSKRPALFICPGGGYEFVSFQNEGTPIQILAEKNGYAAFMLRYHVSPYEYPTPQMELLSAVAYLKEHADEYAIDPDRIAIIGFSAGGHLCASSAALYKKLMPVAAPKAVVLGYPVITLEKGITHEGSARALLGNRAELRAALSVDQMVTEDYPPTFVWACMDDDAVPCENTKRMAASLQEKGVCHECKLYPTGGHGCGLAYENSAWRWSTEMFRFLKEYV